MLFGSKKPTLDREAALELRPLRLVDSQMQTDERGAGKLSVQVETPRFARMFLGNIKGRDKTFEFDEIGVFVWQQIDGKTSVKQIIRFVAEKYDLNLRAAETSTVAFLSLLMRRRLIGMPVES
jgi:hypothetical protein